MNLDLTSAMNNDLLKLVANEENQQVTDDIASQVYLLAMKLKRNKITKSTQPKLAPATQPSPISPPVVVKVVKIDFYVSAFHLDRTVTFDVDTSNTTRQLINQLRGLLVPLRKVSHILDCHFYSS